MAVSNGNWLILGKVCMSMLAMSLTQKTNVCRATTTDVLHDNALLSVLAALHNESTSAYKVKQIIV